MENEQLQEMVALLRDIRGLLAISSAEQVRDAVSRAFASDPNQMRAYRLLYEGNSLREIARQVSVNDRTVRRWLDNWRDEGFVDAAEATCLISPDVLGFALPTEEPRSEQE